MISPLPSIVNDAAEPNEKLLRWGFVVIAAPYFLNDFANICVKDWRWWLAIDYLFVKLFPVLGVMWLVRRKVVSAAELGWKGQGAGGFAVVFLAMSLVGTVMNLNLVPFFQNRFGGAHLGEMPDIESHFWNWLDLTFGLVMVGVTEELVFRGMIYRVMSRWTQSLAVKVAVSTVVFGLIHWSGGVASVLNATLIGAVFMLVYHRTRALPALMLAHFVVDFIAFAGVVPIKWFLWWNWF